MLRRKTVRLDLYKEYICFVASDDLDEVKKFVNYPDISIENLYAHVIDWKKKVNNVDYTFIFVIMNVKRKLEIPIDTSVLVHECVHVANFVFCHKGIQPDTVNDEPLAYLVEWIFKKAHEFYKQWL